MKKLVVTLFVAMIAIVAQAQDVIVKKDGSTILSSVIEVSDTQVKYKKHSNPKGPTYSVNVSELISINYQNGDKDTFNTPEPKRENPVEEMPVAQVPVQNNVTYNPQQQIQNQQMYPQQMFPQEQMPNQQMYPQQQYPQMNNNMYNPRENELKRQIKAGKNLKWWGFAGGMLLSIGGLAAMYSCEEADGLFYGAFVTSMAGDAIALTCYFAGNSKIKKAERELYHMALFQYDIPLSKSIALAANVDLIRDNYTHQQALGLGFNLKF